MNVVNVKSGTGYDVYIGRRNDAWHLGHSKWANPFRPSSTQTRERALGRYYWYLQSRPDLLAALPELRDKTLGCWCAPYACHGHLLAHLALGTRVPNPDDYHYWLECQQCGAPAYFWRDGLGDPSSLLLAGHKVEELESRFFNFPNGEPVYVGQGVGCLVCQSVGAYMTKWSQHRHGRMSEIAAARLSAYPQG